MARRDAVQPAAESIPSETIKTASTTPKWYNASTKKYESGDIPAGTEQIGVAAGGLPIFDVTQASGPAKKPAQARQAWSDYKARKQLVDRIAATPGGADMYRKQEQEKTRMGALEEKLSRSPAALAEDLRREPGNASSEAMWAERRRRNELTSDDVANMNAAANTRMKTATEQYQRNLARLLRARRYGSAAAE
jgi:hypothetical protein